VAPAVRERGIYLVTGGLGGIGLVLARALAESGARPNLVLVGRTEVASRADRAAVEQQLAALEEAGATVLAFGCDVTDTAALARVADAVETRLGPVNGVVHAAGVPGGGLLERRSIAELRAVLAPKAAGVLAIDEVSVLPGTGLLQLMFKAALARSATWPVELRDVVLAAPLVADGTRRVRVRVRPLGSSRRIIVDSRPEPSADAWTEHATATWVEATDAGGELELTGLRATLPEIPVQGRAAWIEFGPRWRSVTEVRGDAQQPLARLVLPERYRSDIPVHPLHPALVDVAAGILREEQPDRR